MNFKLNISYEVFLLPVLHSPINKVLEVGGDIFRGEGQSHSLHDFWRHHEAQSDQTAQRSKICHGLGEFIKLLLGILHGVRLDSKSCGGDDVIGHPGEGALELERLRFGAVPSHQKFGELRGALGYVRKHVLQFAGGEGWAQFVAHFTPLVTLQPRQRTGKQRVGTESY